MRKFLAIIWIALVPVTLTAQDKVNLNFAQVFSGFKFKDSQGMKDKTLSKEIRYSYALNYEKVFNLGVYVKPELGYKNFGAKSNFDNTDIEWNFHYLDFNVGFGYIFKPYRLKPYAGSALYYSYMYRGDLKVGSEIFDVISQKRISTNDYGICLDVGLRYDFSDNSGVFIEYRNTIGLHQMDSNNDGGSRELYNRASSIRFGLSFSVLKSK